MSNRDRNPFANRSAATPATDREPEQSAPAEPDPQPPAKKKYPPKVTFYQDSDDTARMRGAFRATDKQEGDRSLSDFIHKAVMTEVERREQKYNGGRPFGEIEAGTLAPGRRPGE